MLLSKLKPNVFFFPSSPVEEAVKNLGNAIAQSILSSVTAAITPALGQIHALAPAPSQQMVPAIAPAPSQQGMQALGPATTSHEENGYYGRGRGRGWGGRGKGRGGNRGRGGRGRSYEPYRRPVRWEDSEIERLAAELKAEKETRKRLEQSIERSTVQDLQRMRLEEKKGKLLDAHFHYDRINHIKRGVSIHDTISDQVNPYPRTELSVEGGIMVFCDPKEFPPSHVIEDIKRKGHFGVAMGIHPNYSKGDLNKLKPSVQKIKEQMILGNLNGLGEVGLDFLKGGHIKKQEEILEWILPLARPDIPLILHIRGIPADSNNELAYNHALYFLLNKLDTSQTIQLHSFTGTSLTVNKWLMNFPNCYFSFSGIIQKFNSEQIEALQKVPLDRLLLETDSPYLPIRKEIKCNFPSYIGEIAQRVAFIRKDNLDELVQQTYQNTNMIFFEQQYVSAN